MIEQKVTQEQVEARFLAFPSFAEVGKQLWISRERVRQLINRSHNPEVIALVATVRLTPHSSPYCISCKRMFSDKVKYG